MSVVAEEIIISQSPSSSRAIATRLSGQYWRLARRQATIAHIVTCFRDQPAVLPFQCSEAIAHLDALRRALYHAHDFLVVLDSGTTRQQFSGTCIETLTMLDALLSEAILTIAMFAPVSQSLLSERVELHLRIRSLLLRLYTAYQAMLRQAAALLIKERQEAHVHDC